MTIGLIEWVSTLLVIYVIIMGQWVKCDPCDPSKNGDPFDPWPMTHWSISIFVTIFGLVDYDNFTQALEGQKVKCQGQQMNSAQRDAWL